MMVISIMMMITVIKEDGVEIKTSPALWRRWQLYDFMTWNIMIMVTLNLSVASSAGSRCCLLGRALDDCCWFIFIWINKQCLMKPKCLPVWPIVLVATIHHRSSLSSLWIKKLMFCSKQTFLLFYKITKDYLRGGATITPTQNLFQ